MNNHFPVIILIARTAALGLQGKMPKTTAGFLNSAYILFDNAAIGGVVEPPPPPPPAEKLIQRA